jgi:hypothetical protein
VRHAVALGLATALLAAASPARASQEEEVSLHLRLSTRPHGSTEERERLRDLEYDVMARLAEAGAGRMVRDDWPPGECVVTLAGADARAAWAAIEATVRAYRPPPGSYAALRAGGREERVELGGG